MSLGTKTNPLRVAIVGSGPSAFYAADFLQKQYTGIVMIDMFERLPTPFGLVRGGVAPDHQKIKTVTRTYERTASHPNFRFFGNVTFGKDINHADLIAHYHAIIYAVGAQTDRRMNIPGEDLSGSHAATEFVGWYNAHPDYCDLTFDLSQERAAIIGNGNVAMDVARILARTEQELQDTDIADYALDALKQSRIKEIYVLGRRGPAQAAFTNPEIKELGELADTDVIVPPEELELDPLSQIFIQSGADRTAEHNVQILSTYAQHGPTGKSKLIVMRFLVSPVEIIGTECVEAVRFVKNELYQHKDGSLRPHPTDEYVTLPVGLIFRSIGYHGVALPGVPFDETSGIIPNVKGRIMGPGGEPISGEYVVGWIKRGPTGIIGTNKPDAQETVALLLEDVTNDRLLQPSQQAIETLLQQRGVRYVTFEDWHTLDQLEIERGKVCGRSRLKFSRVEEMLNALDTQAMVTEENS